MKSKIHEHKKNTLKKVSKTTILSLILVCSLLSCSKKKETNTMQTTNSIAVTQNPHITADNLVAEVIKNKKQYAEEIVYKLRYVNNDNYFEVYINDLPIFREFSYMAGSAFEINPFVFKSGKQKVTYKMYAVGKIEDEDTPRDHSVFSQTTNLELNLFSYDFKKPDDSDVAYSRYKSPMDKVPVPESTETEEQCIARGKNYYENSFEIDVKVPYEHKKPFENAQDLRKMNPRELEAKVLTYYKKLSQVYNNNEIDNIAKLNYDNLSNEFYALYEKNEEIEKAWKDMLKKIASSSFEMQPIENYKMQFFGDGKLVALMSKSDSFHLKKNSALWAKYKDEDGDMSALVFSKMLYIPEGETEFKVF